MQWLIFFAFASVSILALHYLIVVLVLILAKPDQKVMVLTDVALFVVLLVV